MADLKISDLVAATTPLAGSELVPIVQSGATKRVTIAQLTANITSLGTLSSLAVSGQTSLAAKLSVNAGTLNGTAAIFSGLVGPANTPPTIASTIQAFALTNGQAATVAHFGFTDGYAGSQGYFSFSDTQTAGDWVACRFEMKQSYGAGNEIRSLVDSESSSWAAMVFTSQLTAGAALSTSPAFLWRNATTELWRMSSSGHFLAGTDATYDIGASGANRPRDYYGSGNGILGGYLRVSAASAGAASTTTIGSTTATTVGAAGGASALPATPLGYIIAHVGTTQVKIPYYNA